MTGIKRNQERVGIRIVMSEIFKVIFSWETESLYSVFYYLALHFPLHGVIELMESRLPGLVLSHFTRMVGVWFITSLGNILSLFEPGINFPVTVCVFVGIFQTKRLRKFVDNKVPLKGGYSVFSEKLLRVCFGE